MANEWMRPGVKARMTGDFGDLLKQGDVVTIDARPNADGIVMVITEGGQQSMTFDDLLEPAEPAEAGDD
jgi:hypothetical protein